MFSEMSNSDFHFYSKAGDRKTIVWQGNCATT